MDKASKAMTMMKLGELHCFEEDQRIAILEMVKDGTISMEEAIAEVKATNPHTFPGLKYVGTYASPAVSLRSVLPEDLGVAAIKAAMKGLKAKKEVPRKVALTVSTVGLRIVDEPTGDTLENEPMLQMAYAALVPGDKKKIAYVTSYSRLGVVFAHIFAVGKAKEAKLILDTISSRRADAVATKSEVARRRIDSMSAGWDEEEEEEMPEDAGALGVYHLRYLGSSPAKGTDGEEVVVEAVQGIRMSLQTNKRASKRKEATGGSGIDAILVVSSEGIRTIEEATRDVIHNIMIKAISFSTEVKGKKLEMFAFIAVDDRRDTKECHVFMCSPAVKGQALDICKTLGQAFGLAVKEAKARAGNPFLPIGRIRERAEGPLVNHQFPRKDIKAIKAIGAGQFGRVFLAFDESTNTNYAVSLRDVWPRQSPPALAARRVCEDRRACARAGPVFSRWRAAPLRPALPRSALIAVR